MEKCSLQVLDMSGNNDIGDDGITAIARTLNNSQIAKLYVSRCGITFTGAKSLAAELLVSESIKILDILGNPITVEGARLILQSAVNNEICEQVIIEDYQDDDEVKKMMNILELRQQVCR